MRPLRAWFTADGVVVPAIAKAEDIVYSLGKITLWFNNAGAELYAVASGYRYSVDSQRIYPFFEARATSNGGRLKSKRGSEWIYYDEIEAQDGTGEAVAFYETSSDPVILSIVSEISGNNEIAIASQGFIKTSRNLEGKTIKVARLPVTLPEVVLISNQKIESLVLHLLHNQQGRDYLSTVPCALVSRPQEVNSPRRKIEVTFNANDVTVIPC